MDAKKNSPEVLYVLEDQVGFLLRRATQRNTSIFSRKMEEFGLTPRQFALLVKIRDEGQVSQNRAGRLTFMDRATVQGVVRRLTERGLIESHPDQKDRRRNLLRLSAEGQKLIALAIQRGLEVSKENLDGLSAQEVRTLVALLRRIG